MDIKKVLVADDQLYIQVFVERVLKNEFQLQTTRASDGSEALKKYEEIEPDLIFLDISMPIVNGLEVLTELRNKKNDKSTPIIIMTANRNSELFQSIVTLGITDYLLKPFTYATLKDRVQDILQKVN